MNSVSNGGKPVDSTKFADYLCSLAKNDPARLEAEFRAELREVISHHAPREIQQALLWLQLNVDIEKRKASDQISIMELTGKMMFDKVYANDGLLASFGLFWEVLEESFDQKEQVSQLGNKLNVLMDVLLLAPQKLDHKNPT